jgi:hypothetical protein
MQGVELAEQIKWWDALDELMGTVREPDVRKALALARGCRHPDAQWLTSLFPSGETVTRDGVAEVMRAHTEDPRAMCVVWRLSLEVLPGLLQRAAEMGYAAAQALLSQNTLGAASFQWAQRAASHGFRSGTYFLARCWEAGRGCERNMSKAMQLYRTAAELGEAHAQIDHGQMAFGFRDWERYHWWGCALARGMPWSELYEAVLQLLPSFEKGELGRVLHTVAPVVRQEIEAMQRDEPRNRLNHTERKNVVKFQRVVDLADAMATRARRAIDCWSVVGRRRGVVKDMRVMIAKMAWEEVWRWGEYVEAAETNSAKKSRGN